MEQPRSETAEAEPEPQVRHYGWQTAIVDGAAAAMFAGGMATYELCFDSCDNSGSIMLLLLGLGTYAAGAPLVHSAHGRSGTAAASVGIRALPFAVGGALVAADEEAGAPILFGGMVAAMIVDATVLARERVPATSARFQVTPVVDPRARKGYVVLTRSF